ncbi:MAG: hypothetical protein M0T76_04510 [Desulfobacteraceae bacterium]|nr:hypothetical protein [Desulfobacteraceae bacterium]
MRKHYRLTIISFIAVMALGLTVRLTPLAFLAAHGHDHLLTMTTAQADDGEGGDDSYGSDGYNSEGYDQYGYNRDGYDGDGYSEDGHDCEGHYDENHDHSKTGTSGAQQGFRTKPTTKQY